MLSSCFIVQKLLTDKKIHGPSRAPFSEVKDQVNQGPSTEEEYKKLREILQQRDNEIMKLQCPAKPVTDWTEGALSSVECYVTEDATPWTMVDSEEGKTASEMSSSQVSIYQGLMIKEGS
ncbi:hypothetical protein CB1_001402010 [Camelus ferus]|nr:hypothetical protein CB1_001402010 [Camelus ferus]